MASSNQKEESAKPRARYPPLEPDPPPNMFKKQLVRLGLRRPSKWEPPTLLDHLLASPLAYLASLLYGLLVWARGAPFSPPPKPERDSQGNPLSPLAVRVVCISDTHDQQPEVPDGDLLIHAGDLTNSGSNADIRRQLEWLDRLPHRHKVVVGGNHDRWFDPKTRIIGDGYVFGKAFRSVHYLQRSMVSLKFDGDRRLRVYGAADVPRCGDDDTNAFQYDLKDAEWEGRVPALTDILVTHTPPAAHMDLGLGCPALLKEVWRVRPKVHVFGHVHWGYGREAVFWDDCQRAYERIMARKPRTPLADLCPNKGWFDLVLLVFSGLQGFVWKWGMLGPNANSGTLMVNAAQMYGNTGKVKSRAVCFEM